MSKYDLQYLTKMLDEGIEEDLHLDYKAAASLKKEDEKTKEISKDVSAFANSDGGTIIYGITEHPVNRHLPGKIQGIDRKEISKEWLENIIQNKITPRLQGFIITPIKLPDETVAYVVEIPKCNTCHQAIDKRYYKRYNFSSVPMEDYEVRDIMNRQRFPQINITFAVEVERHFSQLSALGGADRKWTDYRLKVYAQNSGKILAQYVHIDIELPTTLLKDRNIPANVGKTELLRASNYVKEDSSEFSPVLPGLKLSLIVKGRELNEAWKENGHKISYTIFADNAEPISGEQELVFIPQEYM